MSIRIAKNIQTTLDPDFENPLKAANASATPIARTNIWTMEIFKGPILNVIPASNHLLMFFGYTTFIKLKIKNLKLISFYSKIV